MNAVRGAVVLLAGGIGILCVLSALPRFRRPVLARRLTPYLGALGPRRSNLLGAAPAASGLLAVFAPLRDSVAGRLHRALDDGREISDRLLASGTGMEPSAFRAEQVTWALVGSLGGLGLGGVAVSAGRSVSPVLVLAMAVTFGVGGIAARDRMLSRAITRRRDAVRIALPTVVDLVCLSVTAGESLRGALGMVAESSGGPLADELRRAIRSARTGTPLTEALEARGTRPYAEPVRSVRRRGRCGAGARDSAGGRVALAGVRSPGAGETRSHRVGWQEAGLDARPGDRTDLAGRDRLRVLPRCRGHQDVGPLRGAWMHVERNERGSIPEWVMLLVMGIGIVMALWAIVQPDLASIVSDALDQLRG